MHDYQIQAMRPTDIETAIEWAGQEGWNPGRNDADCFYAADPGGFLVGRLDDEPVGVISAVRYGRSFGFIGLYIVKPQFRGMGYGIRLWNEAVALLAGRNVGLDGVVDQQDNYRKSGFRYAYRNIRFEGSGHAAEVNDERGLCELRSLDFERINAYDGQFFPEDRRRFLARWIDQPGAFGVAASAGDEVAGYGVIRPCLKGYKVGPLFADEPELAGRLLTALLDRIPEGTAYYLDVPEVNAQAVALARERGMNVVFETARMYTGEPPALPLDRTFGVTTFELG